MQQTDERHHIEVYDHIQVLNEPGNGFNWYNDRAQMSVYAVDNAVYVTLYRKTPDGPSPIFSYEVGVYYSADEARSAAKICAYKMVTTNAVKKRLEDLLYGTDAFTFARYMIRMSDLMPSAEQLAA